MSEKSTRSRKWLLTINNPETKGLPHDAIKLNLERWKSLTYWCMCDEIGKNETYHTHLFLCFNTAFSFESIKNAFKSAHIDMARGTCQQNRDYVTKAGKWEDSNKEDTNIFETFEEFGTMPLERQGQRNDINDLVDMIKQGMSNFEIIETEPTYAIRLDMINKTRQVYLQEKYASERRTNLEVHYIFGVAGSGKTRSVMDLYGDKNVYRVTDYKNPWDTYESQDVVMFEEFRSSLDITSMLNYMDIYPLQLPARFYNKTACYTKLFIVTNVKLEEQYSGIIQNVHRETWDAFTRRIKDVTLYASDYVERWNTQDYLNRFKKVVPSDKCPF